MFMRSLFHFFLHYYIEKMRKRQRKDWAKTWKTRFVHFCFFRIGIYSMGKIW